MTGLLIAVAQRAVDEPFPFWQLTGFVIMAAGILMILIRVGLRKPPELATTVETNMLTEELRRFREEMTREMARFREEMQALEHDYKDSCATRKDLGALGEKVDRVEKFHLAVHDQSGKALNNSEEAMREVGRLRADMETIRKDVRETRDLMLEVKGMLAGAGKVQR